MANANTNLLSIKTAPQPSAKQVMRAQVAQTGSKYNSTQKDFGRELDKAGAQTQHQDIKTDDLNQKVENAEADMTDAALKTTSQGQSEKTQDASQQKTSAETTETVEQISDISENTDGQVNLTNMAYLFATNTETLLAAKNSDVQGETNLMTIMPKLDGDKSQSMLDLLSGKTWKNDDVQLSMTNQNQQNLNLNQQPQLQQVQTQNVEIQTQPQQQNQKVEIPTQPQQQNQNILNQTLQQNQKVEIPTQQQQVQNQNVEIPTQPQQQNQNILNQALQQNLNAEVQTQQQQQNQNILNQAPQQNLNAEVQTQPQQQNQNILNQTQPQVQQNQFGSEIQPVINSLQPQTEIKPLNHQAINEMLGVNVQVEQNQNSTPIMPIQQLPEYFEQNSQANQNQPQNFSQGSTEENQQQTSNGGEIFNPQLNSANNQQQVQSTANVQNPEAAQAAREDFNIPGQIVEQARMIRTAQNTEMVINLKPEHLGELTLRISVSQNGAVNASFHSDNAQVRAIIENSLVQLRQELNNQGLKVENVQVYAGLSDNGFMNSQGQQAWQQNQQRGNGTNRGRIDLANFEDEVDAVSPTNNDLNATDGVDYKI